MAVHSFDDLIPHVGHEIVCVTYSTDAAQEDAINVAIECETCGCVLVDFDRPRRLHGKCPTCGHYGEDCHCHES